MRDALRLRLELIPHLYNGAAAAHARGTPLAPNLALALPQPLPRPPPLPLPPPPTPGPPPPQGAFEKKKKKKKKTPPPPQRAELVKSYTNV